jgi:signal transduction histidine kinase
MNLTKPIAFLLAFTLSLSFGKSSGLGTNDTSKAGLSDMARIDSLNELASKHINSNPDSAVYLAQLSLELSSETGDLSAQLEARKTLAKSNYVLSNSVKSYDHSVKIIELSEKLNDQKSKLFGQVHLGLAYLLQNRFLEANDVFRDYISLAKSLQDYNSLSRGYLDISIGYGALQVYDTALLYVDSCIQTSLDNDETYYLAMGYNRKGYTLSSTKEYDSALIYHQKALETIEETNKWERCFSLAGLSQAFSGNGNHQKSIQNGEESLSLAMEMNAKWEIKNSAEILAEAYAKSGDFEKAYSNYKLFKTYHDSIFTEENEQKINAMQLRHTENEKQALLQENMLKDKILNQKNTQLYLLLFIAVTLTAFVIVLYITIKNRRKYSEQIAEQRDDLKVLNRTKDRIISILAHDMRSPIGSIIQLLDMIKHSPDMEKRGLEILLDEVYERTTTVSSTLNQLLNWAVKQFHKTHTEPEKIEITKIVNEQVEFCYGAASKKSIEIIHHTDQSHEVLIEGEHARIIIRNLLTNAIKFSHENGKITLNYQDRGDMLGIAISDEGVGMDEETMNKLFNSKASTNPGTMNEKGTGIGLFLSREYAEMNGGQINVSSKIGEGSTFELVLPKSL